MSPVATETPPPGVGPAPPPATPSSTPGNYTTSTDATQRGPRRQERPGRWLICETSIHSITMTRRSFVGAAFVVTGGCGVTGSRCGANSGYDPCPSFREPSHFLRPVLYRSTRRVRLAHVRRQRSRRSRSDASTAKIARCRVAQAPVASRLFGTARGWHRSAVYESPQRSTR